MKKLLRLLAAYALLFSSAVAPVSAETSGAGFEESFFFTGIPVVSVASKSQEALIAASGTVYVVTDQEIKKHGWRNLMEVLNAIPNMDLKYDYYWLQGGQRGFTGSFNGTLMMIDGRQVQNLLAAEAYFTNYFPSHYIKRVEVLQGPNSTLYDANATQGIVNVITKFGDQGKENLNEASVTYGDAGLRSYNAVVKKVGASGDNEFGFSASHHTLDNDHRELADFVAGDQYARKPSYVNAAFRQDKNQFRMRERDWTFDAYARHKGFYAGVDYFFTATEGGYEGIPDVPFTQNRYDRRGIALGYVGYKHTFSDQLSAMAEYQHIDEYDEWIFTNSTTTGNGFEIANLTFNPTTQSKVVTQVTWTPNDQHEVIGGIDYTKTSVGHKREEANTIHPLDTGRNISGTWLKDKGTSEKRSFFIQDGFKVFPDKLKLTFGARFVSQGQSNDQTAPRVSAVYTPNADAAIKLTYGKGFRPPNPFEYDGTAGANIDSQEMEMTELNYSQNFSIGNVGFSNSAAVYHMVSTNKIDRFSPTGCSGPGCFVTKVGGSEAIDGFEDQLRMNVGKWEGFLSGRYISPEKTLVGTKKEVIDVPIYKAKLGLSYEAMKHLTVSTFVDHWGKVKADRAVTFNTAEDITSTEIFEIDPWTKMDVNVRLGEFDLGDGMTSAISLYVENVGDAKIIHANNRGADPMQYMQNPRFFRVTGEVKF